MIIGYIHWINDGWFGKDKIAHLIRHVGIMLLFTKVFGFNPFGAMLMSAMFGVLYETVWDCILRPMVVKWLFGKDDKGGASWRDIVWNEIGDCIGLIACLMF